MALEDTRPQIGLFDKSPGEGVTSSMGTLSKEAEERRRKRESKGLLRTTKTKQRIRGQLPDSETNPVDINDSSHLLSIPKEQQFNLQALNLTTTIPSLSIQGAEIDAVTGPVKPPKEDGWGVKTLDFLFGTEAAVIGISHDTEGWSWTVDNMQQQWSEHPLWVNLLGTASIVGTMLFPATRALSMSAKFGKLATKTGKFGTEAAEIAKWKEMGKVDSHVRSFADLGQGEKTAMLLRKQDHALHRYSDMAKRADAVARGETTWVSTPVARMQHSFDKRFANKYADAIGTFGAGGNTKQIYHANLDNIWKSKEVGWLLTNLPDDKVMPKIQAYMMGRLEPTLAGRATKQFGKLNATEKKFADYYYDAAKVHQKKMLEDGIISADEFKRMGEIHLPALSKKTTQMTGLDTTRSYLVPASKDQLKTKAAGLGEIDVAATGVFAKVLGRKTKKKIVPVGEHEYLPVTLVKAPRLDSPTLLSRKKSHTEAFESLKRGDLITAAHDTTSNGYLTDRLLHTNFTFIRDLAMDPKNIASAEAISAWGGSAAKAAKAGFIRLDQAGSNTATRLQRMISKKAGRDVEDLPWIRKEIFDDIFGKGGMMEQTRHAGADMMDVVTTIYKTMKTAGNIPTHLQNLTGNMVFLAQAGFNPFEPKNVALMGQMGKVFGQMADIKAAAKKAGLDTTHILDPEKSVLKGVNLGKWTAPDGRSFNIADEMFSAPARELIEETSFDAIEGAGNLPNIAKRLREDQYLTKKLINGYAKTKSVVQAGDRVKWFDNLTKAYLAEDMVPKMAYFMSLRGEGLTQRAAAIEVARRLPMYNSVGSAVKRGRKFFVPWATFPTEALRITKNNIMDHPLRMMPWLRAPQIIQSMISGTGMGSESRGEVEDAKSQLPTWAQTGTTVVTSGEAGALLGGASTGGIMGGVAGAVLGKSAGAAGAGAAAGAAFGALMASLTTDETHDEELRGAIMNFLPHSTFMMANNSEDFGGNMVPFKDFQGMLEQMPAEPLAILRPLIDVMSAEDAYGNPVGDGTVLGGLGKAVAGAIGFVAPPIIQKYGFKISTPDVPVPGDPTGVTNVSRFLMDTGSVVNPSTGMPGSFGHDFLLNNFSAWKSYAASGEQQLSNESMTERAMGTVRSALTKNLSYHLQNGNDKEVVEILSSIQGSFSQQYIHDPRLANTKYYEWLERHQKQLGRHPKLRNWSEDELTSRLRLAGHAAGEARSAARNNLLQALRDEMRVRGGGEGTGGGGMKSAMEGSMSGSLKGGMG